PRARWMSASASSRRAARTSRRCCPCTRSRCCAWKLRAANAPSPDGVLEQLQRRARECPHVALAVAVARLDGDHPLDGAGDSDAGVARGVTVAVARRPARARLRQSPRRAHQLAYRLGLELRVRLAARADAFHGIVADP